LRDFELKDEFYSDLEIEIVFNSLHPGESLYEYFLVDDYTSGISRPLLVRVWEGHTTENEVVVLLGKLHSAEINQN